MPKHIAGRQSSLRLATGKRRAFSRGQTLVEYALILAIISVVAIAVIIRLGEGIKNVYSTIDSAVSSAQASH